MSEVVDARRAATAFVVAELDDAYLRDSVEERVRVKRAAADLGARHRHPAAVLTQHAHRGAIRRAERRPHHAAGEEGDVMTLVADRSFVMQLIRGIDVSRQQPFGVAQSPRHEPEAMRQPAQTETLVQPYEPGDDAEAPRIRDRAEADMERESRQERRLHSPVNDLAGPP